MQRADIIVFTGTSGAGRKSIARLVSGSLGMTLVRSATTRPPRQAERPDEDYHFMSEDQFNSLARQGAFLQRVVIGRDQYGILKQDMERALAGGCVGLVLNREGADAVKQIYGARVVRVFIYVDKTTLRERLESKGASYEQIASYLDRYADEVTYRKHCEYIFENVDLALAAERITERLREVMGPV